MFDRGFFLTLHAVRRQLAAMPNDFYLIRLIHGCTRRPCPGERLWDLGQLARGSVLRFLRARNLQGFDIYLLPYADDGNAGYILLDLDHAPADVLPCMRAHGHEPCVVLQTSPGHFQAWIRVSTTPLEPLVAMVISKQLAHTYGADLASTSWRHLGRLAGFTNQKPQRRTAFGSAPWVKIVEAHPVLAGAAQDLLRSAMQTIAQQSTAAPPPSMDSGLYLSRECTITAQGAVRIYRSWIKRWHIPERFPEVDWSIVDLWLARKLLAMHISGTQVKAIIRLGSPDFPRHHGDPEDYLRRTLARAALPAARTVCANATTPAPRRSRDADWVEPQRPQ
ncbi:MAG TPA: DNA-primase RepB domain-containing protein [Terriglobales bacterium]|nr:DNA-primase RepB domain-containing protein [Terriglobales bacterium]